MGIRQTVPSDRPGPGAWTCRDSPSHRAASEHLGDFADLPTGDRVPLPPRATAPPRPGPAPGRQRFGRRSPYLPPPPPSLAPIPYSRTLLPLSGDGSAACVGPNIPSGHRGLPAANRSDPAKPAWLSAQAISHPPADVPRLRSFRPALPKPWLGIVDGTALPAAGVHHTADSGPWITTAGGGNRDFRRPLSARASMNWRSGAAE